MSDSIPDYWARKASEIIGRTDAKQRRVELRRWYEDKVWMQMRNTLCPRKEAERLAFEELHRIVYGENP